MTGKYDFTVTYEVIEMMRAESKVIVNWSYNYQVMTGSSDKYNLNKNYVKVLNKRLCSSIGTIVKRFTKVTITSTLGERTQFYAHPCLQGTNGMIGHWFIFKRLTAIEKRLKITTHQKYLVSWLLKENVKL